MKFIEQKHSFQCKSHALLNSCEFFYFSLFELLAFSIDVLIHTLKFMDPLEFSMPIGAYKFRWNECSLRAGYNLSHNLDFKNPHESCTFLVAGSGNFVSFITV